MQHFSFAMKLSAPPEHGPTSANVPLLGDTRRLVAEDASLGIYRAEVCLTLKERQAVAGCVVARPWGALAHHDDAGFTEWDSFWLHESATIPSII